MYKKFSKELHRKYDEKGRKTIKNKITCRDNPNIYGYDLMLDNNHFKGIEVEIIAIWKDENKPPFKDNENGNTRLFERKLNKYDNDIIFIQLSKNLKKCCIFTKTMVDNDKWYITSSFDRSFIVKNPLIIPTDLLNEDIIKFFRYIH